jgi:glutamine amidotransferase-like uncharacterized protein
MKLRFIVLLLVGATACNSQNSSSSSSNNNNSADTGTTVAGGNSNAGSGSDPTHAVPAASATPAASTAGEVGLVWNGTGACDDDCALAGANAVTLAGLTPRYVNENTPTATAADIAAIFQDAKVWVMPGGYASNEVEAMSASLTTALLSFISNGGGYVGWCAGSFSADASIGTINVNGLGIFPGNTEVYNTTSKQNSYGGSIEKLTWLNETHYFYLEGGPNFTNLPSSVEVVARYDDQVSVAAARTKYGNGRVFLSGVHPEAPTWWWEGTGITDPDGSDLSYAADMIKWAASLE